MYDLHNAHLARKTDIINAKFQYVEIYECEFDAMMLTDSFLQKVADECQLISPIHPSEALIGGRTEAMVLQRKPKDGEKISFIDVNSMYPSILRDQTFPNSHPKIILNPPVEQLYAKKFKGLIKARILPPRNLEIPLLPVRVGKPAKLLFTLCHTCADKMCFTSCKHSEQQRSFIGTYTTIEIYKAIELGYKILHLYEVWHYEKWSNDLFKGFIDAFVKIKIAASGFPPDVISQNEKEEYVKNVSQKENITLAVKEVNKNAGLRSLGKLMITGLWGKLAQNQQKSKVKFITKPEEFFRMILSDNYDISSVDIISEDMMQMTYMVPRDMDTPHYFQNYTIASYVTSYARLKLYEYIEKVCQGHSDRILYLDTDSIIFVYPDGDFPITLGSGLGEMSDEIVSKFGVMDSIGLFVCTGCKSYAFQLKENPDLKVIRCKGICINNSTKKLVNLESMLELITFNGDDNIEIRYYNRMKRDNKSKRIYYRDEVKTLSLTFDKRVVVSPNLDRTLPFGHVDIPEQLNLDLQYWQDHLKALKSKKKTHKQKMDSTKKSKATSAID